LLFLVAVSYFIRGRPRGRSDDSSPRAVAVRRAQASVPNGVPRFSVRFQANRLKNFFPSEWHREHEIVYVKADLLKVAGRVPGAVGI
jgi:hypothetical protein